MENISVKGILIGILVIFVIDILGGLAAIPMFTTDMSPEALQAVAQTQGFLIWGLSIGTLSTVVGGFIAARFGKAAPYKNAAVIGILGLLSGLVFKSTSPLWFDIAGYITVVPAALLGAYIMVRKAA